MFQNDLNLHILQLKTPRDVRNLPETERKKYIIK